MSVASVRFLNEKCLVAASVAHKEAHHRTVVDAKTLEDLSRDDLGRMLGREILQNHAAVERIDRPNGDAVFRTEVYVLTPVIMSRLYDMMRDEIRKEAT